MKRGGVKIIAILLGLLCLGCASSVNQDIELSRFALDQGEWDVAIYHAQAALTAEPSNVRAALNLSAAYAGRSGFKVLTLLSAIANEERDTDIFHAIREAIGSTITAPDDLRRAIEVLRFELTPLPSLGDLYCLDYYFQLGVFMGLEIYGLASIHAQPLLDGPIDVNNITETDRDVIAQDLADADEYMIEGGMPSDNDLVENVRQTFCALIRASGSTTDFTLAALRDMTLCQLSPNDGADLVPGDFQSPLITSCSDFDYSVCDEAESI